MMMNIYIMCIYVSYIFCLFGSIFILRLPYFCRIWALCSSRVTSVFVKNICPVSKFAIHILEKLSGNGYQNGIVAWQMLEYRYRMSVV